MRTGAGYGRRVMRIIYLLMISAVTALIVGFIVVSVVEEVGPTSSSTGRIVDRIQGESTVTRCNRPGRARRCTSTTYPNYSVIGERQDGTLWIVVGQGPYDAMRGENGQLEMVQSSITNRVVSLTGDDHEWHRGNIAYAMWGLGALLAWGGLVYVYEWRRRSGKWKMGEFAGAEKYVAIPGVLLGVAALTFLIFSKTWGLDLPSSADAGGGFLDDPFGYNEVQAIANETTPGIGLDEDFRAAGVQLTVVSHRHLAPDIRASREAATRILAIPLLRVGTPSGRLNVMSFLFDGPDDETREPVRCPASLLAFPSSIGSADSFGGFICFDRAAVGGTFVVLDGSNLFREVAGNPHYDDIDGAIYGG